MRFFEYFVVLLAFSLESAVARYGCECGIGNELEIDNRIISGATVQPHAFPWIVYMKYGEIPYCGGAVINDRYILTAAHCVYGLDAQHITVMLGGHDSVREDGMHRKIISYQMHPQYTRHKMHDNNDIALIKLKRPLTFNNRVRPICLPNSGNNYDNVVATISGWGLTETGNRSRYLLENRVRVLSPKKCMSSRQIGDKFVPHQNMCAYGYDSDTCQGDSGSPLIVETDTYKYEAIGVVSWGVKCGTKSVPAVYTKVDNFLPWIYHMTRDANYCKA